MNLLKPQKVEKLIEQCLIGDNSAQNELFKAVYGKMSAVCMRYANNSEEAKDMFQTGMIKVFKNLKRYNFKGNFEGWIRRIIVNNAIDYLRKNKNIFNKFEENILYEKLDEKYLIQEEDEDNFPNISTKKIIEYIQKLSPAYRTVFNLFVIEDKTHKEIAKCLNISEGTSKSNLTKAKIKLKKLLKQELIKIEK